ncbi:hypothetical protein FSARC_11641 [Fusarium sarcochroum]|uniref:AB hydrolase-1 domain-containing protein n=1 Tax=Fusarium sarcochroum TaxID=1208366 RepID=A0A8H4TE45_9HYPO|nr:hypothetical protein FSARC_11641 [Fusarium sarcochroum]
MSQTKPVVAIVPGGFCGPDLYEGVANTLREDGFTVIIVTSTVTKNLPSKDTTHPEFKNLANKGLLDDVDEIHAKLTPSFDQGLEVVIFGHSYGSLPALLALQGQTVDERKAKGLSGGIKAYAVIAGFAYALRGRNVRGDTEDAPPMPYFITEEGVFHIQDSAKPLFFSDLPAEEQDAAWAKVLGSQSRKSLNHLSEFTNSEVQIPKTYILCEKDEVVAPMYQEMYVKTGEFDKVEKLPSGHFLFVNPVSLIYTDRLGDTIANLDIKSLNLVCLADRDMSIDLWTEFGSCATAASDRHEYFAIFVPLLRLLQTILSSPRDIDSMDGIRDSLEQYYLNFPPDLLEFSSIKFMYQLEAMIWFHGIFILTFVRQDLLEILIDEALPLQDEFYFAPEHAILLGEALPTLLQLDSALQRISPATVFFINLPSTIMASAMWRFHCLIDLDTTSPVVIDIPESLVVNVTFHQEVLQALSNLGSKCDIKFIRTMSDILSVLCRVDPDLDSAVAPKRDADIMSLWDRRNWDKYSLKSYENGAICLQVLGQRFTEEKVLACLRAIDLALGGGEDYMA